MIKIKKWFESLFSNKFLLITSCDNLYVMYRGRIKIYSIDNIIKVKPKNENEKELHYTILKSFLNVINKTLKNYD